jgi:hypothetical protein
MLRSARLLMMVLVAMFIVAVPTAVAQSPTSDQYAVPDDSGAAPGNGTAASVHNATPVQVRDLPAAKADDLPFTGGQISLIALIGLALLAVGSVGIASTRRRTSAART